MLPAIVLIFVAAGDVDSERTVALVEAVSQTLGTKTRVLIQRHADAVPPGDAVMSAALRGGNASAAASVAWFDSPTPRARLDVRSADGFAARRDLAFAAHDQPAERGRAVGLVLASLVMGHEPPPLPNATATTAPASRDGPLVSATDARFPQSLWAIEGFADGGLSVGGQGSGFGGGLATRRYTKSRWGARLGLHARGGSVPAAQASSLTASLAAGGFASLRVAAPAPPHDRSPRWDLGGRAEFLLLYEALTHFSSDDPSPVHRGRFLPGAAALLEAQWRMSPTAALHLATGIETAFGVTRVVVRGVQTAELASLRAVLEVGLRVHF